MELNLPPRTLSVTVASADTHYIVAWAIYSSRSGENGDSGTVILHTSEELRAWLADATHKLA